MKRYPERLRELREDRDLLQKDIAEVIGTTQQVYSRYENGQNEMPIRHLITIAKFHGVTSDYILGISENK